jgi:hypothetical protein
VAEGIPFAALTQYNVAALYALKGEIVRRGIKAITGFDMPVFPKRRFQHGAIAVETLHARIGRDERGYRRTFDSLYSTMSSTTGSLRAMARNDGGASALSVTPPAASDRFDG